MARMTKGKATTTRPTPAKRPAAKPPARTTTRAKAAGTKTASASRATKKNGGSARAGAGTTVIFNAPILASTRSGLTKLKGMMNKSSQGKVIDALVKDALKRAREEAR